MKYLNLLTVLFLIQAQVCISQTNVSGNVSGHWSKSQSQYLVTGPIHVPSGDSLLISAGAEIVFQDNYEFVIDSGAVLKAVGTEDDFIIFRAEDPNVGHGGIRFIHSAEGCTLSYCNITNGKNRNVYPNGYGGAISCDWSDPVIENCEIHDNEASGSSASGGAIYCSHSNPVIRNNIIFNNRSLGQGADGGAICCRDSSNALITENGIFSNFAEGGGGAISCEFSSPEISFNVFENDTSLENGGAIYCKYASPLIKGNTILSNWVHGGGGGIFCDSLSIPVIEENEIIANVSKDLAGGGILCGRYSDAIIRRNTIKGNTGDDGGGICLYLFSTATIENNIIAGNQGLWVGGGICCDAWSNATIRNNIIVGNWANYRGGGIFCGDVQTIITNCTIVANSADSLGGGLYVDNTSFPVIFNSIIWENSAQVLGDEIYLRSLLAPAVLCSLYVDYTIIDPSKCEVKTGTGEILWGEHIYTDGPVFSDSLFHLSQNSPGIDSGTDELYVSYSDTTYKAPTSDFEDNVRPASAGWDLGAFEFTPNTGIREINVNNKNNNCCIYDCYPNPFHSATNIHYKLTGQFHITIRIFNSIGQDISTLVQSDQVPGDYHIMWDAGDLDSGLYYCRFTAVSNNQTITEKTIKLVLSK